MANFVTVDSDALTRVGNEIKSVSDEVEGNYNTMKGIINQVTASDSWKGEASTTFLDTFEKIRPEFEKHLTELADLGPTILEVCNGYTRTEEENVSMLKKDGEAV